jgi:hypothetical protein
MLLTVVQFRDYRWDFHASKELYKEQEILESNPNSNDHIYVSKIMNNALNYISSLSFESISKLLSDVNDDSNDDNEKNVRRSRFLRERVLQYK